MKSNVVIILWKLKISLFNSANLASDQLKGNLLTIKNSIGLLNWPKENFAIKARTRDWPW